MSAVRWDDVGFAWPDGPVALDGVDLEAPAGDVLLVVGDSGSGKSTLLRTVNGLVPHGSGGRFRGEVVVGGRRTRDRRPREMADLVGFVHQDPEAQFVVDHVEHDIAFALENLGTDPVTMRRRIEELLDALGVAHLRDRSPATLSGGERQRCAVAGAMASGPSILVLDEPTSMLDPQGADDLLAVVGRLHDDLGTTVVMAEHRLERAGPMADRAVLLTGGRVERTGSAAAVLTDYDGAPSVTHLGRVLGWDPPPLTVREARRLARDLPVRVAAPDPDGARHPAPGPVTVTARDVAVGHGADVVVRVQHLELRAGEVVALLGRNGSGKTTLLRALAGLAEPLGGRFERAGAVAYVPQDPGTLLFAPTVRAEVEATLRLIGRPDPAARGALARLARPARAGRPSPPQPVERAAAAGRHRRGRRGWGARPPARRTDPRHRPTVAGGPRGRARRARRRRRHGRAGDARCRAGRPLRVPCDRAGRR